MAETSLAKASDPEGGGEDAVVQSSKEKKAEKAPVAVPGEAKAPANSAQSEAAPELSTTEAAPKKKKKKKKRRGAVGKSIDSITAAKEGSIEIAKSLFSDYRPTRRMALLFLLSLTGLILTSVYAFHYFKNNLHASEKMASGQKTLLTNISKFVTVQKEVVEHHEETLQLGRFVIKIEAEPGQERLPNLLNVAEVNIVIQCDSKSTCGYVETNHVRTRDHILQELQVVKRSDLMTTVGKKRLQLKLRKRLNSWLTDGRVTALYFTNMVIN